MQPKDTIIVTMPAIYRPEILQLTLWSFHRGLLSQFEGKTLIINLDPSNSEASSARQQEQTLKICRHYFDKVISRFPCEPGFGAAVRWVWSEALEFNRPFFHLEDDWVLNRKLDRHLVFENFAHPAVGSIRLQRRPNVQTTLSQSLSLNPVFLNPEFIAEALTNFRSDLDPEKQFKYEPLNSQLKRWRHYIYPGVVACAPYRFGIVSDTGTHWRKSKSIEKRFVDGRSFWVSRPNRRLSTIKSSLILKLKLRLYKLRSFMNC